MQQGTALLQAIADSDDARRFVVEPSSFALVPNSPCAMGKIDSELVCRTSAFEWTAAPQSKVSRLPMTSGSSEHGEVPRDSGGRSKEDTLSGKRWVPFARAAPTPLTADLHLVVNWEDDGKEIQDSDPKQEELSTPVGFTSGLG